MCLRRGREGGREGGKRGDLFFERGRKGGREGRKEGEEDMFTDFCRFSIFLLPELVALEYQPEPCHQG